MHQRYDSEPAKRTLQMESVAHITVQKDMEKKLWEEREVKMTSREFLCYLHCEFYQQLPEAFRVVTNPETGKESLVVPGEASWDN
ncbi:MAG: hypothetical protein ACYDH8_16425 [Syntrophales bacterium]